MKNRENGQSLVEILLALGLMAIILPGLITGFIAAKQGKPQQKQRLQAISIIKETEEAVRQVREQGWTTFATDGTFYPHLSGATWSLPQCSGPCPQDTNGFTTQVVISDVSRDANGAIVSSGGSMDVSSKKIVITVSWNQPYASSTSSTMYLTRHDNMSLLQTTGADFSATNGATLTNTAVVTNGDGEVVLGAGGGGGDWCQPSKSITQVDLPKSGVANAIYAIEGAVFAGTGNNSSGVSFAKVALGTTSDPPPAAISAIFNGFKTNGVFGEPNYAYITTDTNPQQVVIISLTSYADSPTNSTYAQAGSISLPGSSVRGQSIYVLNNTAYVTSSNNKLYDYDITTRTGSHTTPLNSTGLSLAGTGNKIVVATTSANKTYAYIATNSTTTQLQIVDVTNPSNPSIVGNLNLGTGQAGVDVYVNPSTSRAYLATTYTAGKSDFYIVNVSSPTSPATVGSGYSTNGMSPTGVTIVTGNKAIIVGTGGTLQYQVINLDETKPLTSCAGLSYATGVYGVSSVFQSNHYAYSYIITGDANAELKIILGGGGGNFSSSGQFISAPFDVSVYGLSQAFFNRFDATFNQPSNTSLGIQIGSGTPSAGGNCSTVSYSFIGPAGTSNQSDVYATGSAIPVSGLGSIPNPARCFKYKVYMNSSDYTQTPELDDFLLNFSP